MVFKILILPTPPPHYHQKKKESAQGRVDYMESRTLAHQHEPLEDYVLDSFQPVFWRGQCVS